MRLLSWLCVALLLVGCFGRHKASSSAGNQAATGSKQKLIVTPGGALVGKVALVNTAARFVVLNFPVGHLPALDQHLSLYRAGLKVGEVKVTGPQYDDNIVADLTMGESEVGDQVRDR